MGDGAGRPPRSHRERGGRRAGLRLAHGEGRRDRLRHRRWSTTRTASVSPPRWGWTRPCSSGRARVAASGGRRRSSTSTPGELLDVVPGRDSVEPCRWLAARSRGVAGEDRLGDVGSVRARIGRCSTRCCPTPSRSPTRSTSCKLANTKLDECRRRVQNETLGHRGRKDDPLYRSRRLLTMADERLDDQRRAPARSGCSPPATPRRGPHWPGTPRKSSARSTTTPTPTWPSTFVDGSAATCKTSRARSRSARSAAPSAGGATRSSPGTAPTCRNGPTEAANNLIKRVKRVAFGFTRFRNYRIRVLLYAGRPNWDLLATITPR